MWSVIFAFLAVAMVALLIVGLVRPALFRNAKTDEIPKRTELAAGSSFLVIVFAGLSAFLAPNAETQEPVTKHGIAASKETLDADLWIKPEALVQFPKGEIACRRVEDLGNAFLLGVSGRGTKMNAYFEDQDGTGPRCLMLPPNLTFKVIDAERRDASLPDALLLEVVDPNTDAADEGAYVAVLDRSMAKIVK